MPVEVIEEGKKYVKMPKKEFERWEASWKATVELAKNEKLQEKIKKSREEYDQGKSREWKKVKDKI